MLRRRIKTKPTVKSSPLVAFSMALSVGRKRISSTGIVRVITRAGQSVKACGAAISSSWFSRRGWLAAGVAQAVKEPEEGREENHRRRHQDERREIEAAGHFLCAACAFDHGLAH